MVPSAQKGSDSSLGTSGAPQNRSVKLMSHYRFSQRQHDRQVLQSFILHLKSRLQHCRRYEAYRGNIPAQRNTVPGATAGIMAGSMRPRSGKPFYLDAYLDPVHCSLVFSARPDTHVLRRTNCRSHGNSLARGAAIRQRLACCSPGRSLLSVLMPLAWLSSFSLHFFYFFP